MLLQNVHVPCSLQYAVLVKFWICGVAVRFDGAGGVGTGKVEESYSTCIQGAEEWEARSPPKKGNKNTIAQFPHPCVGHECHPKYVST